MRISDWSSDVCSSDLKSAARSAWLPPPSKASRERLAHRMELSIEAAASSCVAAFFVHSSKAMTMSESNSRWISIDRSEVSKCFDPSIWLEKARSEEHTSELQSLMRISYAVFCFKKK